MFGERINRNVGPLIGNGVCVGAGDGASDGTGEHAGWPALADVLLAVL